MSLLKELQAKGAVAWSPIVGYGNYLAVGSKGGLAGGFENTGGEFKLVSMNLSDSSMDMKTIGAIKTPSHFTSLAWRDINRHRDTCPYGIVAGGMDDGSVSLWNPAKFMEPKTNTTDMKGIEIGRISRHKGIVNSVQFNPNNDSAHLLASGGSDGEVYIMSLEKLASPGVFTPGNAGVPGQNQVNEVTAVAWNTSVNYILAAGAQNGSVTIWDLKQKKPWCELRDPQRGIISAVAWNPAEGLQIATASGDDQRPVVKLWDLRSSTTTPLAEFHEHTAGILSLSWCPSDPGLLLSCAKDNRTLLWDLYSQKSLYEFPAEHGGSNPSMGSDQFFGGGGAQRRTNVQWASQIPAIASTTTLDGRVQVWGLSAGGSPACRPPKWMRRPVGASFGFGGKLVTISNPKDGQPAGQHPHRLVHVHRVVSEASLVVEAEILDAALESKDYKTYCEQKINSSTLNDKEKTVWSFMKILFENDARQHLLQHLGLDAAKIQELNNKFAPPTEEVQAPTQIPEPTMNFLNERIDSNLAASDVFGSSEYSQPPSQETESLSGESSALHDLPSLKSALPSIEDDKSPRLDVVPAPVYTKDSEAMLMQALLVGNFELAVNCCLHYNQMADALLLASCGGPELWEKTLQAFFAHQNRPVMKVVSAVIKSDLHGLVDNSNLGEWQETLSILSTYAKSDEFPLLCDKLGMRLEASGDMNSAILCFMCAVNVEKTVGAWYRESEIEGKSFGSTYALQRLVEKVSIFLAAVNQPDSMGPEVAERFAQYSSLMAAQGRLDIANKYARFSDISCAILRDRIYHAAPTPGYAPPPSPFDMSPIAMNVQNTAPQQHQYQYNKQPGTHPSQGYGSSATDSTVGGLGRLNPTVQQPVYSQTPAPPISGYGAPAPPQVQQQQSFLGQNPHQQTMYPPQQQTTQGNYMAGSYQQPPPSTPSMTSYAQPHALSPHTNAFASAPPTMAGMNYSQPPQQHSMMQQPPPTATTTGVPHTGALGKATLGSSRIATPSVDLQSQQKDGFVTSVGNKELSRKYGNVTNSIDSPVSQTGSTKSGFGGMKNVVPGSTENVGPQDMAIVNSLNSLVAQLQTLPLTMMEQKQMPEILKGKEILFTKLNIGELSPSVLMQVHEMVNCFSRQDFGSAQTILVALTRTDWTDNKDWLRGVKALIHICSKRFR